MSVGWEPRQQFGGQILSDGIVCVCRLCSLYPLGNKVREGWGGGRGLERGYDEVPGSLGIGRAVWVATPLFFG